MGRKRKETRADRIIRFIHTYCITPSGDGVGTPMKLAKFQIKFIRDVFDNPHNTRRAYLSIARKNGKSGLIAAIVLAFLVGPERKQNSQIISCGMTRDQAKVVFNLALDMLRLQPAFDGKYDPKPSISTIVGLKANVKYRAIASKAGAAHGLSPYLAILDEVGQIAGETSEFINAITTSQGAYTTPLLIAISTQAPMGSSMFSRWLDDAAKGKDKRIISHVYAAPPKCNVMDRKAWRAANPALGIFRDLDDLKSEAELAARGLEENKFRNLYLNQRVMPFDPFISPSIWKENGKAFDPQAFIEGEVYGGLDLSKTTDLTALVLLAKWQDEWHVQSHFWTPLDTLEARADKDDAPYVEWVQKGFMNAIPGQAIEYGQLARDISDIVKDMNIAKIAFDSWGMDTLRREMDQIGLALPLEPFVQGKRSFAPALNALEIALLKGSVRHGNHPVLTMCAASAVTTEDDAGNRLLTKSKSLRRIDGLVAMTMAMGVATGSYVPVVPLSPWDADPNFTLAGS